jgi:ABC-2 type transport system ATP-binding protein
MDVSVRNLGKRYGAVRAVDDLSFEAGPGSVTGFLGPNGAGKTTRLRALVGLVRPTSGTVLIGGLPYSELPAPSRTVGAVLDADGRPRRSGRNQLLVRAAPTGVQHRRVDEVLEQVGLTSAAGRRVADYSTGMRQCLGLAAALLGEPAVLILDEPANGLDPEGDCLAAQPAARLRRRWRNCSDLKPPAK